MKKKNLFKGALKLRNFFHLYHNKKKPQTQTKNHGKEHTKHSTVAIINFDLCTLLSKVDTKYQLQNESWLQPDKSR